MSSAAVPAMRTGTASRATHAGTTMGGRTETLDQRAYTELSLATELFDRRLRVDKEEKSARRTTTPSVAVNSAHFEPRAQARPQRGAD
jgi:hypothetical protein